MLLDQSDVFLFEFARQGLIFLRITSGVTVLVLGALRSIKRVVIDYHIVGSILKPTDSLLSIIWFR